MFLEALVFTAMSVLPQATTVAGVSTMLAHAAREEMTIIDRLQNLRTATEKLPKTWQVRNRRTKKLITKQVLLYELETMELMAAERWNKLVRSMALLANVNNSREDKIKSNVNRLYKLQSTMNHRLDTYNKKLKTGILVNLAAKLEGSKTEKKRAD